MFLASGAAAFLRDTRRIQLIEDDEIVAVTPEGATFWTVDGETVARGEEYVYWDIEAAEKGGFETFMLKEIYEQPDAIEETIGDRIRHGRLELEGLGLEDEEIRNLRRIVIVACGTAYHSGVVAPLRDRGVGAHPGRARHRERVALPQPRALEGHARHRHHPIRRDRGHAGGDAAGTRVARAHARHHEHDGHADHA